MKATPETLRHLAAEHRQYNDANSETATTLERIADKAENEGLTHEQTIAELGKIAFHFRLHVAAFVAEDAKRPLPIE
jgi:hypothetical protein